MTPAEALAKEACERFGHLEWDQINEAERDTWREVAKEQLAALAAAGFVVVLSAEIDELKASVAQLLSER